MEHENKRPRRGRPPKFGEAMDRIHIRVTKQQRQEAEREAARLKIPIMEVYRRWMERGREAAA